jgi:hypothetical protein
LIREFDLPGTVIFIGSIFCILLAVQYGGENMPWSSAMVIGLLVGGICLFIIFVVIQWLAGEYALIPLRIFNQRTVITGFLALFFLGAANAVVCNLLELWRRVPS